jgi:hypothetical protein
MNKHLMTPAVPAAVEAAALTSPAHATLQIAFTDGTNVFTCADQAACDMNTTTGNLLRINTVVGNFDIEVTAAVSIMGKINGIITNTGTTPGTLTMIVGDTNFSAPVSLVRESGSLTFNNDIGESATLAFYGDKANGQPEPQHGAFCCLVCGPAANFLSIPLLARFFLLSAAGSLFAAYF